MQKCFLDVLLCMLLLSVISGCGAKTEKAAENKSAKPVESAEKTESTALNESAEKPAEETEAEPGKEAPENKTGLLDYDGDELVSKYDSFEITSKNLNGGVWDDVISKTDKGENRSPELSWDPVEGATVYAVYMVDISMHYYLHWVSNDISETTLPEGWAQGSEYVGPYPPPGGTHTYDVYVIAMKSPIERLKGGVGSPTQKMAEFIDSTDTDAEGNSGNIVAIGHLSGTFTH